MKKLILFFALITLSGCATTAVQPGEAKPVPPERIFLYQNSASDGAKLTVVRDSGFLGGGCYYGFYINGKRAASLDAGEKVEFSLPAGEWMLGMKGEGKVCIADNFLNEREITLSNGQHKGVRLFSDPSGNLDIKPISIK